MSNSEVVYLIRHARAGERRIWEGDDVSRPLSLKGEKQSTAIGKRLAKHGATALYSSPYVRCIQTLEPLAKTLGTKVRKEQRLLEGEPFEGVLDLLAEVEDRAVLCSHGDIIPAVIQALVRRGMEDQTPPDWRKASVWVLKRKKGRISKGKVWPPPT
jgi:8-oxo-dGTP diphosphatase